MHITHDSLRYSDPKPLLNCYLDESFVEVAGLSRFV